MATELTRTELKRIAQDAILHGVGNVLGYWEPSESIPESQRGALDEILKREADRVARLFGYEEAWTN